MKLNNIFSILLAGVLSACMGSHQIPSQPLPTCKKEVQTTVAEVVEPSILWRELGSLALAEAKMKDHYVVMVFGAKGCQPCQKMKQTTFRDPQVVKLLNDNFIPIYLDGDKYVPLMEKLEIEAVWPTTVILNSEGAFLFSIGGYIPPETFKILLAKIIEVSNQLKEEEESTPPPGTSAKLSK